MGTEENVSASMKMQGNLEIPENLKRRTQLWLCIAA